jgi:hypothetical protein
VTKEVERRIEDLTHQIHREILGRCVEQIKTLAPILICSMKIFIQILSQGNNPKNLFLICYMKIFIQILFQGNDHISLFLNCSLKIFIQILSQGNK